MVLTLLLHCCSSAVVKTVVLEDGTTRATKGCFLSLGLLSQLILC
jgi:hypothetical protein